MRNKVSGRPILFNATAVRDDRPSLHRRTMRWIEKTNREGRHIYNQCGTLRQGFVLTYEDWNLFDGSDVWREVITTELHGVGLPSLATTPVTRPLLPSMPRTSSRSMVATTPRSTPAAVSLSAAVAV